MVDKHLRSHMQTCSLGMIGIVLPRCFLGPLYYLLCNEKGTLPLARATPREVCLVRARVSTRTAIFTGFCINLRRQNQKWKVTLARLARGLGTSGLRNVSASVAPPPPHPLHAARHLKWPTFIALPPHPFLFVRKYVLRICKPFFFEERTLVTVFHCFSRHSSATRVRPLPHLSQYLARRSRWCTESWDVSCGSC